MILITGATGNVGSEIIKLLSAKDIASRAMVRSAKGAEKLAGLPGVTPVTGDFDDAASLEVALAGIDTAFLLTNSSERAEGQQLTFVAAAKKAGVRHIVKFSQIHANAASPVRFLRYHAAVEQAIRDSGMAYTFLRANLFMQEFLSFRDPITQSGQFFAPIGDGRVSLVDIRDLAAVAVAALTEPGHDDKTYVLTGPEALSHAEIAVKIGAALGREVSFVDIAPGQMREALVGFGFPHWQADGVLEDYAHYQRGEAADASTDIATVTGAPARSFDVFIGDYAKRF
ncbi:MAG: NAD(P)-dependent oxidoreductase [Devosia sp.]|uniref:SDR family oxidoreductase n=1 Tax=Devosia sp. TaxID=1871048 RepID=UPI00262CABB0|nr:SDR family oxidoreductase [Devosia sp.]MDB5528325.1 NAD(P)-dependent oxidoreductase [Devosia sp.]